MFPVLTFPIFKVLQKALILAVGATISVFSICGQTPAGTAPQTLSPSQSVERAIKGGEVHSYQFELKAGQFVSVTVEPKPGLDLVVSLYGPDGKMLVDMNGAYGYLWKEVVSCIADGPGTFKVDVKTVWDDNAEGGYSILLGKPRKPKDADRTRISAERALSEGRRLYLQYLQSENKNSLEASIKHFDEAAGLWRQARDKYWEAVAVLNSGWSYGDLNQSDKAIKAYTEASSIFVAINNRMGEGKVYNAFGLAYEDLKQFDTALAQYQKAVVIRKELGDLRGAANAFKNMASVSTKARRPEAAIGFYKEEMAVRKEMGEHTLEMEALYNIAALNDGMGRQEEAANQYETIVTYIKQNNVRTASAAELYFKVASAFNNSGKFDKALEYHEVALSIRREKKNLWGESFSLIAIGGVYNFDLRDYQKAKTYFEPALAAAREAGVKGLESIALFGLGIVAENLRDYPSALEHYKNGRRVAIEDNNYPNESLNVGGLASVNQKLGKFEEARDLYEENLKAAQKKGSKRSEGLALGSMGTVYLSLNQFEKSKEYYQKSADVHRADGDRLNLSLALSGLGLALVNLNEFDRAIGAFTEELNISKEIANKPNQYLAFLGLATVKAKLNQYDEAETNYLSALDMTREMKDRGAEANTLVSLGNMLTDISQFEKGKEFEEKALVIFRETKDRNGESNAMNNIGRSLYSLSRYDEAQPYFEQALAIKIEIGEKKDLDVMLSNMGSVQNNLNQYDKAKGYYDQATEVSKEIRNRVMEGLIQGYVGGVYYNDSNQYEKALAAFERSLATSREIKNKRSEAAALDSLGTLSKDLGRYEVARGYYEQSLAIFREVKNRFAEAAVLSHLGDLYIGVSNYKKAGEYFEQAIAIQQDVKDRRGIGASLLALGYIATQTGEYEKAKEQLLAALSLFREIKVKRDEAYALHYLAKAEVKLGRNEKAQGYLEQSLVIFREIKDRRQEGRVLNSLGEVFRNLKQYPEVRKRHQMALGIFRDIKTRQDEGETLKDLMETAVSEGSPFLAVAYGKKAIDAFQEIRGNIKNLDKESQESFMQDKESAYRLLANQLISQGRVPEAQIILSLLKREEFSQLTRTGDVNAIVPYTQTDSELLAKIENLISLEQGLGRLQKIEPRTPLQEEEAASLRKQIAEINRALDAVLKELASNEASAADRVAEFQDTIKGEKKSLRNTLKTLGERTGSGVVALYTVLGEEARKEKGDGKATRFGWVVMVTEKGYKAYPIDTSNLDSTVFQFRDSLRSEQYDPKLPAEKIYNALFRQSSRRQQRTLEQDLKDYFSTHTTKTIMWSLDGVLRYIPMAALHDGEGYLVEKYRNVVLTNKNFEALGEDNSANWQVLGLGVSEERDIFRALPGVKQELENIVRAPNSRSGIFEGTISLNDSFKKQAFFNTVSGGNYAVVHIASHYSFNAGHPDESFLLVGDGRMTFSEMKKESEISLLFAGVDLLTLSACDTAVSGNGKETEGFAFTAQELGAKSVIASLWPVSDAGTAELMIRFYKLMARGRGISKGEAFRQAQLSLLGAEVRDSKNSSVKRAEIVGTDGKSLDLPLFVKDPNKPFAHPHYWASFVLIGNWR